MLECCEGVNCQASNFLRAFGLIPQAHALGLLVIEAANAPFGRLIQTSCRFILEQIHLEMNDMSPNVKTLVGIPLGSTSSCDHEHTVIREATPFVIDLAYNAKSKKGVFVDILKSSINKSSNSKAWCKECNSYAPTKQTKSLASPPNFMCINANIQSPTERAIWGENDWLPLTIGIVLDAENNVFEIIDLDKPHDLKKWKNEMVSLYDLRSTIAEVKTATQVNLVSHING
jgi:PAB-dependent poly(A)-specific ribonuclease subunit 2